MGCFISYQFTQRILASQGKAAWLSSSAMPTVTPNSRAGKQDSESITSAADVMVTNSNLVKMNTEIKQNMLSVAGDILSYINSGSW